MITKKVILPVVLCGMAIGANGQAAFDALQMSQNELRGTSRFMSMAGAFGALGGDISTLNQNPGGIGVYRSSDLGITLSLDFNSSKPEGDGKTSDTRFNCNNVGYVGAIRLNSETMPNVNWGFSYNRNYAFHRHYKGGLGNLQTSASNYIAGVTSSGRWTSKDLAFTDSYDPYLDGNAPWISILSYDSYIINPTSDGNAFQGLYGNGTSGFGEYEVDESGHNDEYSINFGGNVKNMLYWGFGFGITDMDYRSYNYYGEALTNAYVGMEDGSIQQGNASYGFVNYLTSKGTGYNFKLGFIVKPINELRFGFAVHTPTYYDMRDRYYTVSSYEMSNAGGVLYDGSKSTNNGYVQETWYDYRSPWRMIVSMAGVIGRTAMVDLDYEYVGSTSMRLADDDGNEYVDATDQIKQYFQPTHIMRLGGEVRVSPNFSVRAGYSYQSSPVKSMVRNNMTDIVTVSTNPAYQFDKKNQYFTCGAGYHAGHFYLDLAYVHRWRESEFHAFSPVVEAGEPSVGNYIKDNNDRISMTIGFRF